jgi:poly-gamma-glutamate synthase PgsB/CapB
MTIFLLFLISLYAHTSWILLSYLNFKHQRNQIQWRVHVNGIRGKSTVTRYVAAVFREAGYHTFGKTTGSAARILQPNGEDFDFGRKGYPNVNEQIKIIQSFSRQKAQAVIIECMAVNPVYANWLETMVMESHIGIITNVRYDHADYMGESLEEIAHSLSKTIPENGIVITAESNYMLLKIIAENAQKKNAKLLVADGNNVDLNDLVGFSHFVIEDNIAIGYKIAEILGVPAKKALKAMQLAIADPGTFGIEVIQFNHYQIAWANLFAVNDRESFIYLCKRLFQQYSDYQKIVILNNRYDRPNRVKLFAEIARDLDFYSVVTFGDYETEVNQIFSFDLSRVINLGNSTKFKDTSGEALLQQIVTHVDKSEKILLVGTVNIHTHQAKKLLDFFKIQREYSQENYVKF